MTQHFSTPSPLISVVITCYNHAHFLPKAIESVLSQSWPNKEVIIVDDGSTDTTAEVAKRYSEVRYIHQENAGLSAARNTGIREGKGEYFLFLDADDWLLPDALATNAAVLQENPTIAFASGGYVQYFVAWNKWEPRFNPVEKDHYIRLLEKNFIAMHATVLYRRRVFDEFLFDEALNACEDYDLYLHIARKFAFIHHKSELAVYRIYGESMSGNAYRMLTAALRVMEKHRKLCKTQPEVEAWHRGVQFWRNYYGRELYYQVNGRLMFQNQLPKSFEWKTIRSTHKKLYSKLVIKTVLFHMKKLLRQLVPVSGKRWLHQAGITKTFNPPPGSVSTGDLHRIEPLSTQFGYDRGGPVDRFYIEQFLEEQKKTIKGRVLEIGDDSYSKQFGGNQITQQDILHVDASNPQATIIGDLASAPQIPDNSFDCIVLTQTLHLIYDFHAAVDTCYRILKPGGSLLLTVPGITPIDHGSWKDTWYWAFTDIAISRLLHERFTSGKTSVKTYGNVYIATAFLYGMGISDVTKKEFDHHDPHYQVIIAAQAVK